MNRLKEKQEEDPDADGPGIYFCVSTRSGHWHVSTAIARHIEACLDTEPRPNWIRFVDLSGASVRIRSRDVEYLNQSTPEQRALERQFNRAVNRERKADRDWEEGD